MSTVATTRPPHTHTLPSSAVAVAATALSTPAASPPLPPAAPLPEQPQFVLHRRSVMHPDCLLLQTHGVTSPRLSPTVPAAIGDKARRGAGEPGRGGMGEEVRNAEMCSVSLANRMPPKEADELSDQMDVEAETETEATYATSMRSIKIAATLRCDDADDDDEAVSLCSEDSELSVGQEGSGGAGADEAEPDVDGACDLNRQRRLLLHNVGDMMALCAPPSAFSSVSASGDGSDARSSASTDETSTLHGGDEECSGTPTANAIIEPFMMANALRMPVPVPVPVLARTPASPFQAEFMRKSHLYAEELVKQQMQFMAAARASAFTLRGPSGLESAADKRAFRPQAGLKMPEVPANLAGIHSQLTAITKMSQLSAVAAAAAAAAAVANKQQQKQQSVSSGGSALAKLSALGMLPHAPTAVQMQPQCAAATTPPAMTVSSLSQLQAQMQAHLPFMQCTTTATNNNNNNTNNSSGSHSHNNNNLHEPSLKFSIDNILKADFGRRITEPLKRATGSTAAGGNGTRASKYGSAAPHARSRKAAGIATNAAAATMSATAIDLTSLMCGGATTTTTSSVNVAISSAPSLSFSHSLAHICTNSSDSSGTAVSSSYGGGANSEHVKSPVSQAGATGTNCNNSPAQATNATAADKSAADDAAGSFSSQSCSGSGGGGGGTGASGSGPIVWPAWVYCTRYSDRPSSGPRARKPKKLPSEKGGASSSGATSAGSSGSGGSAATAEDKRPRTAFSGSQLARLKHEFTENRYLTEKRRQQLSAELGLNEAQIKIWFQNKRAKLKKSSGTKNPLALQLMAQGLYNHSTVPLTREEEELQELQERENAAVAGASAATATSIST